MQSQYFTKFYNFTPSLTSKDNGDLEERLAGAVSSPSPSLSFPLSLSELQSRWMFGNALATSIHLYISSCEVMGKRSAHGLLQDPASHGPGPSVSWRKLGMTWS